MYRGRVNPFGPLETGNPDPETGRVGSGAEGAVAGTTEGVASVVVGFTVHQ